MWLKTAYVEEYGVLLSNMGVLWWRRKDEKQQRKWAIYDKSGEKRNVKDGLFLFLICTSLVCLGYQPRRYR